MRASKNGRTIMVGDSSRTGISELTGMCPVKSGKSDIVLFNAGADDSMALAHDECVTQA